MRNFEKNTFGNLRLCTSQRVLFKIHMQFSLSESNVGINMINYIGNVYMFHTNAKNSTSSKCHLASLCSKVALDILRGKKNLNMDH